MRKWRNISLAGVAAAMLLATACGAQTSQPAGTTVVQPAAGTSGGTGYGGSSAAPSTSASTGTGTGTGTGTQQLTAAAGQLAARTDAKLGSIVTDSAGMTLYRFDKDTVGSKSACDGQCATTWPPVPANDATASAGLNPELLGSITRSDGSKQLTLAGWPMYRFAKDAKAGDTNGQGVNGTWFASATDGKKAGKARPALGVLDSPTLGKVLTDKNGKTLYLFTKDQPWPMKTACDAACLRKWTPSGLVTEADVKALGLDPKVIFTFTTPNGTRQEAFNCWPAYTFKGDKEAGQTNGQGVGGVWFAIKKDIVVDRGKTVPAAKAKAGSTSSGSSSSSGYSSSSSSDSSSSSYGY
jgi:predicted lipoprotein with Yx(FWY)xxD motif